jgi:hypothetical protein
VKKLAVVSLVGWLVACSGNGQDGEAWTGELKADAGEESDRGPQATDVSRAEDIALQPRLTGDFEPFADEAGTDGPVLFLEAVPHDGPGMLSVRVNAANLGSTAGLAFYLEFDPEILTFEMVESHLSLDDGGGTFSPYFTRAMSRPMRPGIVSYGAARFCKAKIPWGSLDQCGGKELAGPVAVATFTFSMKAPGQSAIRFPGNHRLIRRPDHSPVQAQWIGGTIRLAGPQGEARP